MEKAARRSIVLILLYFFVTIAITRSSEIDGLYVGCFAESPFSNREFNVSAGDYNSADLRPFDCAHACGGLGYEFAALTAGVFCFCAQSYGAHGPSSNCTTLCSGNSGLTCGGEGANAVYNASVYNTKFVMHVTQHSRVLTLFAPTNLTTSLQNDSEVPAKFSIGDGGGLSPNATSVFRFHVAQWGLVSLTAESNTSGSYRRTENNVRIHAPIAGAAIQCGAAVSTLDDRFCRVEILQGTEVQASWQFPDGPRENISIADPSYVSAGPVVPQWDVAPLVSVSAGVFVMPSSYFSAEASLLALEIYGLIAGKVKVFVAASLCSDGSTIYCVSNKSCLPIGQSCRPQTGLQCPENETLCTSKAWCHSPNDVSCSAPIASSPRRDHLYHQIKHVFTLVIKEGYNLEILANQTIRVGPGDILGWVSDGKGKIGAVAGEGRTWQYKGLRTSDVTPEQNITQSSAFTEEARTFRVKAIGAKSASFLIAKRHPNPGVYKVQVNLSNPLTPALALGTQYFTVQQPVTSIAPLYPDGFEFFGSLANSAVQLLVNVSSASNLTVSWMLNGSALHVEEPTPELASPFFQASFNHTFSTNGEHRLVVTAVNNVSTLNTTVIVKVLGGLLEARVSLLQPSSPVYKGALTAFNATVAGGDGVKFAWQFDNGAPTPFSSNSSINHRFARTGLQNVTVTASNLASDVQSYVTVDVRDPLSLSAPAKSAVHSSVNFTCVLKGPFSSNEYFYWDFGDGTKEEGAGKSFVQHSYTKGQKYKVECRVRNDVVLNSSVDILVEEPVTGLLIKNISGVELNETQTFTAITETGNELTYVWYIHGESMIFLSVCSNKSVDFRFNETGMYSASVNVSNSISSEYASITFPVQLRISGLGMTAHPNPAPSNTTINFNVSKVTGTNVTARLDFGDGFELRAFDGPLQFNRTFQAGQRLILLTAENAVSQVIILRNLTVQDVVRNVLLWAESVKIIGGRLMVPAGPSASETVFRANTSQGTDVSFAWNCMDVDAQVSNCSRVAKGIPLGSGGSESSLRHTFAADATYNISVFASNLVSREGAWLVVHAQEVIDGLEVHAQDGVAAGEAVIITFTTSSGSNVTYTTDFGDGDVRKCEGDAAQQKVYSAIGVYTVKVFAQNQINSASATKLIFVQHQISGLRFAKPLGPVATGNSTLITWSVANGTNVTYVVDFGDGNGSRSINSSSVVGSEIQLPYTYLSSGQYEIRILAHNRLAHNQTITGTVLVEQPIRTLRLDAPVRNVRLYDDVTFQASVAQGENVVYQFDFGDGSDPIQSHSREEKHTYERIGSFLPSVRAQNSLGGLTAQMNGPVNIKAPVSSLAVSNLTLTCKPTALGNESYIEVEFDYGYLFQCQISFGDGEKKSYWDSRLREPVRHLYNTTGEFEVVAMCSNDKGRQKATVTAHVDVAITGLVFTAMQSQIEGAFGDPLRVKWTWSTGTNIVFTVTLPNRGPLVDHVDGSSAYVDLSVGVLDEPGTYNLTVNATNPLTPPQIITVVIVIRQKITGLQLTINPYVRARFPVRARASVNAGSPINLRWEHGDGDETTSLENDGDEFYSSHEYDKAGNFTVNVTAWNKISTSNVSASVRVLNPVEAFALLTPNVSIWPSNTLEFKFTRNDSIQPPTDAVYIFQYGNGQSSRKMQLDPGSTQVSHHYAFSRPGCFRVKLSIENAVSHVTLYTDVQITSPISGLDLTASNSKDSPHPGNPGGGQSGNAFPVEYPVSFAVSNRNGSCVQYVWDFGDGSGGKSGAAAVSHVFSRPGTYNVTVTVSNALGRETVTTQIALQRSVLGLFIASSSPSRPGQSVSLFVLCGRCGTDATFQLTTGDETTPKELTRPDRPFNSQDRSLLDRNFNFPFDPVGYNVTVYQHEYKSARVYHAQVHAYNQASSQKASATIVVSDTECPLPRVRVIGGAGSLNTAPRFTFGTEFTLTSDVSTDCSDYQATFAWTLFTANAFYGNSSGALSLPPEAARNKSFPENIITNQSSICISHPLAPGTYIAQLTVRLPSTDVENADRKYIKIAAPDIVPYIAGGSARSHGWKEELVLNANGSSDPLTSGNQDLIYEWFCSYHGDIDNNLGCFGNGQDRVEFEGAVYRLGPRTLFEAVTYEFTVKVSTRDRTRSASAVQAITVRPGNPPDVRIRCIHNCGSKITRSERLALKAECSNCSEVSYQWTLHNTSSASPPAIWPGQALTSQNSNNLVIMGNTFEAGRTYTLRMTITRQGGTSGFADYKLETNEGPRGGSCDVTPLSGTELQTKFSFTCRGWQDEDLPLTYEIWYPQGSEGEELAEYRARLENSTAIFPAGSGHNHSLTVAIRVKDVYDAYTTVSWDIQVLPYEAPSTELLNMTVGNDSRLSQLLGQGAVQSAVQLMTVVGSMLNANSSRIATADSTQIRSSLADALSQVHPLNLEDVRQIAIATKTVTDATSEVSADSQVKISSILASMTRLVVHKAARGADGGVIQEACTPMLESVANVLTASSLTRSTQGAEPASLGLEVMDDLYDAMLGTKTPEENATVIRVRGIAVSLSKRRPENMAGSTLSADRGEFRLPTSLFPKGGYRQTSFLTAAMTQLTSNPHQGNKSSGRIQSSVLSLDIKGPGGEPVPVKNLTSPIDILLPRNKHESHVKETLNISRTPLTNGQMTTHRITLPRNENPLVLNIIPEDHTSVLTVYLRYNEKPTATAHDLKATLSHNSSRLDTEGEKNRSAVQPDSVSIPYRLFVPLEYLQGSGTYFVGVLPASEVEQPINYTFGVFSSGCYYWYETLGEWTDDGCKVGGRTSRSMLHCRCNHLTWFGADMFVPPTELDLDKSLGKLTELHKYPALLATFCTIVALYLLCLVWARRKDKADLKKVGLVVVSDCDPAHSYRYEVTVYTGRGKHAGTTANVSIVLSGELDQTPAHTLNDETRPVLQAGGVDSFLLTTSGNLGNLTYIRVWHDNSGKDPAWFLSQIVVRNVETEAKFFFLCDRWLACDEGDGQVDRLVPAAGKQELGDFVHLFRTKTTRDLSNSHLWFSVAFRPARSQFTRAQRVSCCLSLLMCTMLVNVMWYNVPVKAENNVMIDAGFFTFTWHQFIIGIQSSLIVFPINLLIVQLFRKVAISPSYKRLYLDKGPGQDSKQRRRSVKALSLSQITTSTTNEGLLDRRSHGKDLFTSRRKPGREDTESDADMFSLLQSEPNWTIKPKEPPLATTKPPQPEDDIGLEYLSTDAIYQLLYRSETQTDKGMSKSCMGKFPETQIVSPSPEPSISPDPVRASDTRPLVENPANTKTSKRKQKLRRCKFVLPWWFVYVAWFLCLSTAVTAGFFTLLYGLSFTKHKQEEWLVSLFVSIINDIFISQPLKVICFALFFALIFKRPQEEEDDVINAELAQDEEWLQQNLAQKRGAARKQPMAYNPPDQEMLRRARLARFKERQMHSVLREILCYFLFVWMVLLIAYGHRDVNAPIMTQAADALFVGTEEMTGSTRGTAQKRQDDQTEDYRLVHVTNTADFWVWVKRVLIPGLYNNDWYNGKKFGTSEFLSDRASIVLGSARLRQLRVKEDTCKVARVLDTHINQCHEQYSWESEERTNHNPGWKPANHSSTTAGNSAWHYRTATDLKGHPILGGFALYRGGGYVVELGTTANEANRRVRQLMSRGWVDAKTRAIFVEFTIYNGNNNMYGVVSFLLELTQTGGSFPFAEILVTRLDRYIGNIKLFVLACEVTFVLFTIYFTYQEVKRFLKSDIKVHVREFWTWIELWLIGLSWAVVVLYFVRFTVDQLTKSEIRENPGAFVNFHYLATTDQLYGYVFAFVVFLISIKILRLLRFNRRMSLLGSTLRASFKELCHFGIIFGLVFLAFAHLCFLVFSIELEKFSSFVSTLETLLSVMLGKFSYLNFQQANRVLGPLMFFFYTVGVVFILMNMFLSIIIENFRAVKRRSDLQSNEHEIVSFMMDQFKAWLGINSWRMVSGRVQDLPKPVYKKRRKVHTTEQLKERVDRLVTLIKKVHFNVDDDEEFLRNDGEVTYRRPSFKYEPLP